MDCPNCYYSQAQHNLISDLRRLWSQHIYWTRFAIKGIIESQDDLSNTDARLMRNPSDFAAALRPYYAGKTANDFERLLSIHLSTAGELFTAMKNNDSGTAKSKRIQWYANADEISELLHRMNPMQSVISWRNMMYKHLALTERGVMLRLAKEYDAEILNFENIEADALEMADYMSDAIIRQFFYPPKS